jgi:DNA-binding NtrC family response regulator
MFGRHIIKASILVIDHDDSSREEMRAILSSNGYKVIAVRTGSEGLERIDAEVFDFILADLLLPDMFGVDLLKRIKQRDFETKVILMGTHITTATILESVNHGAFDVVYKPFLSSIILQRLDYLLSREPLIHLRHRQRRTA